MAEVETNPRCCGQPCENQFGSWTCVVCRKHYQPVSGKKAWKPGEPLIEAEWPEPEDSIFNKRKTSHGPQT